MKYQPEIDGLRAVAILAVVIFHVAPSVLPGGYLGVDVFFVISGYLITGLLAGEWAATGRISLAAFYARRVRRLAPAYFVVILAVLAAGSVLLPPDGERQALATSAAMSTVFLANFHFWRLTGYFADTAEWQPLLHLWTLAVEEQFYLVWPIAMSVVGVIAQRRDPDATRAFRIALASCAALSFALCLWALDRRQGAAFFLMPTRVWEFASGGLLALGARNPPILSRYGCSLAGVLLLLTSFIFVSRTAAHPGFPTLIPVFGTVALLVAARGESRSLAMRVLRWQPVVTLGRLSYSWYLWHWPLLAFTRAARLGEADLAADVTCAISSLALSGLTYVLVENPVRRRRVATFRADRAALVTGAALLCAGLAASLFAINRADEGLQADARFRAIVDAKSSAVQWPWQCNSTLRPIAFLPPLADCRVGAVDGPRAIFVWGDSYAYQFLPALDARGRAEGVTVFGRVMFTCPPLLDVPAIDPRAREDCDRFRSVVLPEILRGEGKPSTVVLATRWLAMPGGPPAWRAQLDRTLQLLAGTKIPIVVIGVVPEFRYRVPECIARARPDCSTPSADELRWADATDAALQEAVARTPNARLWRPRQALCEGGRCRVMDGKQIYYIDAGHLSRAGALAVADSLWAALLPAH